MYGNYRHHYLLSSAASPPTTGKPRNEQQQQQQHNAFASSVESASFNGLPNESTSQLAALAITTRHQHQNQQEKVGHSSNGKAAISLHSQSIDSSQQQQQQIRSQMRPMSRDYCTSSASASNQPKVDQSYHNSDSNRHNHGPSHHHQQQQQQHHQTNNNNSIYNQQQVNKISQHHNNHHQQQQNSRRDCENGHQLDQDQYASQLRKINNQFSYHRKQAAPSPTGSSPGSQVSRKTSGDTQVQSAMSSNGNSSSNGNITPSNEPKPTVAHVNFNRAGQSAIANDDDEDEGSCRKKKYLTAKYGQQQMNLIKKRLKVEMWLYEQLQELAKGSKSEAELDEIDVDLDLILDMDDDDTRRHWLKKTLAPFDDLPKEKLEKFIGNVLEQAKLL